MTDPFFSIILVTIKTHLIMAVMTGMGKTLLVNIRLNQNANTSVFIGLCSPHLSLHVFSSAHPDGLNHVLIAFAVGIVALIPVGTVAVIIDHKWRVRYELPKSNL